MNHKAYRWVLDSMYSWRKKVTGVRDRGMELEAIEGRDSKFFPSSSPTMKHQW